MQGALLTSNYLMKISASDVRIGNLVEYQGKLWRILKKSHVKPGKGGAFAQLEMKAISDNTKLNERFRSEDKLEKAHVEPRQMQYLYPDGQDFVFMDLETFEQMFKQIDRSCQHWILFLQTLN